jgi:hypothetical protein
VGNEEEKDEEPKPEEETPPEPEPEAKKDEDKPLTANEKKRLHDEAASYRTRLRKKEAELEAANAKVEELGGDKSNELRIENAFLRQALTLKTPLLDVEAAFKLLDTEGIALDEDGKVSGMDAAMEKLVKRYAFLVDDLAEDKPKREPMDPLDGPSGAPFNKKKDKGGLDVAALESKFPALKRGR